MSNLRLLLCQLLAGLLAASTSADAWVAAGVPRTQRSLRVVARAASSASASPLSEKLVPPTRAATRWDRHLDLARTAHRRKHWGQVRVLCSRVINVADDWNAVEQAHLRLALAEQKSKRVEVARRVFQVRDRSLV